MNVFTRSWMITLVLFVIASGGTMAQDELVIFTGEVTFKSEAPLEIIQASNNAIKGAINTSNNQFAFSVPIRHFEGFNAPLQKEHFNENYMESHLYPNAIFSGTILDEVDWKRPSKYAVRAKGQLNIHGVKVERIIKGVLTISEDGVSISTNFQVLLEDHDIRIPRIVWQKISETIDVQVSLTYTK
jgi:hypothetical protein